MVLQNMRMQKAGGYVPCEQVNRGYVPGAKSANGHDSGYVPDRNNANGRGK